MRKLIIALAFATLLLPLVLVAAQPDAPIRVEVGSIDANAAPTIELIVNVFNNLNQPIRGLTEANFALAGADAGLLTIARVENITDDNIPFSAVLAIDVSDSMSGLPLEQAKTAAQAFVDSLRPNDPVAIVTFGSEARVVQDFTTDRAALSAAIANLQTAGQTALYQGAYEAVRVAGELTTARRAVILLSDGAEYGGRSLVDRDAARTLAVELGVPVYTIGLGYGFDRTFLQQLSQGTNARFSESPTPEELVTIYTDLSALFRSQYILTLAASEPRFGETLNLELDVNAPEGSVRVPFSFRVPINTPLIRVLEVPPLGPLTEAGSIRFEVLADQPLASVTVTDGGETLALDDFASPYTLPVDPFVLPPGGRTYVIRAADAEGDVGTVSVPVEIEVLPPVVEIAGLEADALVSAAQPVSVRVQTQAGSPLAQAEAALGDEALAPVLSGEQDGIQTFDYLIDPMLLEPGPLTFSTTFAAENGGTQTTSFDIEIAALPPDIIIGNLEPNETLSEDRVVTVDFVSQTPVIHVAYFVDGMDLAHRIGEPWDVTLNVLELGPGEHLLRIVADNAGGESATEDIRFFVSRDIALTQTALAPTATPTATLTPTATATPSPTPTATPTVTPDVRATAESLAQSAATVAAELAVQEEGTRDAVSTRGAEATGTQSALVIAETATFSAVSTSTAAADALATLNLQLTGTAQGAATQAQGTAVAFAQAASTATRGAQATSAFNATATEQAQASATANQMATQSANATATDAARSTAAANAQATAAANTAATAAFNATATDAAQATATANTAATAAFNATATSAAQATATANTAATAAFNATATSAAQATNLANTLATNSAIATSQAVAQATQQALATAAVVQATSTAEARSTLNAGATLTLVAQTMAAAEATATRSAAATGTAVVNALATVNAQVRLTAAVLETQAQQTEAAVATETAEARATATAISNATRSAATASAATVIAQATNTQQALQAAEATATAGAEATTNAQATRAASTQNAILTLTPLPTPDLLEVVAENPPTAGDLLPLLLVIGAIAGVLALLFILVGGRRRRGG